MDRLINKNNFYILFAIAIIAILGALYFYNQASALKANPQKVSQEEIQSLINKVSQLIILPTDEMPTIATVTDPDQLRNQPFFANATKGDRVLIYTNAKKAILYNPSMNKIVEVAPVNIGSTQTSSYNPTNTSNSEASSTKKKP